MAGINLMGTAASLAGSGSLDTLSTTLHVVGIVLWLVPWLLLRRNAWTRKSLRALESITLLLAACFGGLLGRQLLPSMTAEILGGLSSISPAGLEPTASYGRLFVAMGILLGMAMVVIGRAGLVPSRPRYTALLTGACVAPLTIGLAVPSVPFDPSGLMKVPLSFSFHIHLVVTLLVWWSLVTAVCTVLSNTVYGLHREVHRAKRLGQYELEYKIGEGGMGVVYRASHAMMRRPTAIKLLRRDRNQHLDLARFEREVQQTARLTHPNTITIYDYGQTRNGVFYYSMEWLRGATLQKVVTETGVLTAPRVLHILRCVSSALVEAHDNGLIHRDIKPANIYLAEQGGLPDTPKLLDFGLVKQMDQENDVKLTLAQSLAGTPLYISPEAITDPENIDGRSDLYGLGAVAYFMLTGRPVFEGKTPVAVCSQHLYTPPEPVAQHAPGTPSDLCEIVMACLAKDPADRPDSAAVLLARLEGSEFAHAWKAKDARQWWAAHESLAVSSANSEKSQRNADTLIADLGGRMPAR